MIKKVLSRRYAALALLMLLMVFLTAEPAAAEDGKAMYLKKQGFSYFGCEEHYSDIYQVFGKGEKVNVLGKYKYKDNIYYKIKNYGLESYIPADLLTGKKPSIRYTAKASYKELKLSRKVRLYDIPSTKSEYILYDEDNLLTLGQTNNWYKVFVDGKVRFIKKTNSGIKKVTSAKYPYLLLDDISESKEKNLLRRFSYIYAMLPEKVRQDLKDEKVKITLCKSLPNEELEAAGCSGFTRTLKSEEEVSIYVKESKRPYRIEQSLIHEIGHAMTAIYGEPEESLLEEGASLNLEEHYSTIREHIAETFDIRIKMPGYLKKLAPNTYDFFSTVYQI